ncbi:MAG: ABC transporter ATP-binding protein [Lachnospiraceae bacterium]|nr:ABC transporter ATP-binding protein [Lachnospiraceae bacterium]
MIEITDIKKSYGKKEILKGINLRVPPGEICAITGGNGSGKTTLLQIMSGIIKPDEGSVKYFGHDIKKEKDTVSRFCGYLPQENPLIEELTVQDNISLWSGKRGRPEQKIIDFFNLEDILKMKVGKLSGGMKRRVAIACTVTDWPSVLLLDEPTNALDIYYKREVRKVMKDYLSPGGILVIVTHDEEEVKMSNSVYEMKDGKLFCRKRIDEKHL